MTPEHWEQIEAVFQAALTRDAIDRSAFVDRECAGNEALRTEVMALLSAEEASRNFLSGSALETTAGELAQEHAHSVAGRWSDPIALKGRWARAAWAKFIWQLMNAPVAKLRSSSCPPISITDPQRVHRFQQEARAVLALNHPNIVTTYEVGDADGVSFIASEFIEGETLRQVLAQRPRTTREAVDLVMQIANALAAAHDAGIVHRDIKPENIMLRPDGYVKVLDFGVAKLSGPVVSLQANINATSPGMLIGTARYMSPEQTRGIEVDGRSDLWSLGVVLYEILTGQTPFSGATPSDCIAAILEREPPSVQSHAPDVPDELSWSVRKLLRKDRDERYQTAKELVGDLRELQQRLEVEATLNHTSTRDRARDDLRRSGLRRKCPKALQNTSPDINGPASASCQLRYCWSSP